MEASKKVDFNNIANYRNCSKKLHKAYVCMPPKNTVVINKLEQYDVVRQLGGKTYFSIDDIKRLQKSNAAMFTTLQNLVSQGRAYVVTDRTPFVLCGIVGELWVISADKLASTYTFLQNGQPLIINKQTLSQKMKGSYLDWTVVRTSQMAISGQNMACFVPASQKGQIQTSWGAILQINGAGVKHGKGDFVVCAKLPNGQPNLADRWVVNGEIFATTYNNQGWTDCLSSSSVRSITIDSLPKLVPQQTVNNDKGVDANVFKQKCDTLMKELQKVYKFNVKSNTYETVKDYTGFAYEVEIKFDCYLAKYVVEGNFSHTYSVKSQTSNDMVKKVVTANETDIWFACSSIRSNSAITMSIRPRTNLGTAHSSSWAFPYNSDTKVSTEWRCRVGTISDINCVEEVKLFKSKCGGRDRFLINRNNVGVDFNVFKQKCDNIVKELKKVYKFNVKSSNYKNVKDYTGLAYEVDFSGDCYVAEYVISGQFTHTYSVKDKVTGVMTEKTVNANETYIRFGCSATHNDSAIAMSIKPIAKGLHLSGWAFPNNSNTKNDDYWSCKVGTIGRINCSEEVKLFKSKCGGRDRFLINRNNVTN